MLILLNCTKRVSHNLFMELNTTLLRVITRVSPSSRLRIPYCKFPAFFLCAVVLPFARLCVSVSLCSIFLVFSSSSYHSPPCLCCSLFIRYLFSFSSISCVPPFPRRAVSCSLLTSHIYYGASLLLIFLRKISDRMRAPSKNSFRCKRIDRICLNDAHKISRST